MESHREIRLEGNEARHGRDEGTEASDIDAEEKRGIVFRVRREHDRRRDIAHDLRKEKSDPEFVSGKKLCRSFLEPRNVRQISYSDEKSEEEREQQSVQKENSGKSQQKEHEVKRRVAQKERQLKQKVAIENTQEVLRQKKKKNEMAQKQQRHRSQERGKIAEADFKYIKSQLEAGKGFGGGSSYCEDSGFTLDISDAAMSMAELEMMAQNQIEAEAEAEVEAEMSLTDGGTLAVTTAGAVTAGSGAGTAPDAAPATAGVSVDVSV